MLKIETSSQLLKDLFKTALLGRENSHSPYSHCRVGAAVRTQDGSLFSGCNVENSSYGASICAEQVAITKAISEKGETVLTDVLVVTDADPAWTPCGICRQVIAEFGQDITIYFANTKGNYRKSSLQELLPLAFTPKDLEKK